MSVKKKISKKNLDILISSVKKGKDRSVSALNGIVGDYLNKQNNSLAIEMGFYHQTKPINLNKNTLKEIYPNFKSKICILIHGVCANEATWNFSEKEGKGSLINYGTLLEKEFAFTPLYIRYNSGLHISENGKNFSNLIKNLLNVSPVTIKEIVIIAHSMGGLVTRTASHLANQENLDWVKKLKKVFFIGSPHEGAPLEKFGNVATNILKAIPIPFTKWTGDILNLRSSGIKDLRYGYLLDEDWKDKEEDALLKNNKNPVPLLEGVSYYVITGTLTKNPDNPITNWFGDAMVRRPSALGKSKNEKHIIVFPSENHKEFPGVGHLKLTYKKEVYEQIKIWMSS